MVTSVIHDPLALPAIGLLSIWVGWWVMLALGARNKERREQAEAEERHLKEFGQPGSWEFVRQYQEEVKNGNKRSQDREVSEESETGAE